MIEEFVRTGAIKRGVILRLFNIAGDVGLHFTNDEQPNLFPTIARTTRTGNTFHIFGGHQQTADGSGVRDYVHLADVVEAFEHALAHYHSGTFNIGTGEGKSVLEVVKSFELECGSKITTRIDPPRIGDVPIAIADITHTKDVLGWQPKRALKDMVQSTLQAHGK